ncbi:winged helix DNA-binding domain-containing protein [Kribbella deserti]|uniref:Winged helix DNA-binding domain-containing protein n=1 Tax=Kribbella deserti TaxID=1926257 RepID=A0ABV6QGZ7_9ACTN
MKLTWDEVSARRLLRHFLTVAPGHDPAGVVRAMSGAHAQIITAAELSIALRCGGTTRYDVQDALWTGRSLVKTFGPRGTVHLLPTEDLPLWTGALQALPTKVSPFKEDVRMSERQTELVIEALAEALADDELTIEELTTALVARLGEWAGDLVMPAFQGFWPRWQQAIAEAANAGVLCYAPNKGRKAAYTNPHRWLPGFKPMPADEAVDELLRRYLWAYGPATPAHFAQWLSAPRGWASSVFERAELARVEVDGLEAWVMADDVSFESSDPAGVRLLPYFDAFVVGSQPRELLFPGKAFERALGGGQAGNYPVVLVDGVVAGVWHLRRSGRRARVTVELLGGGGGARVRTAVEAEAVRVGEIVGAEPTVAFETVTVGPHA